MSKFEFKLPDIGEGVTEGEIVSWLVKAGDAVAEDQDMVEVMTDKATVTIGAPAAGTISELKAGEGDTVPVGDVLVVLDTASGGRSESSAESVAAPAQAPAASGPGNGASAVGDIREELPGTAAGQAAAPAPAPALARSTVEGYRNDKPLAAPATRKLARELGVDLTRVSPTGDAGRVTQEDVRAYAAGGVGIAAPQATAASTGAVLPEVAVPPAVPPAVPLAPGAAEERVPLRGLRKRIYENMARAKRTAAHFTYVDECECTKLRALRTRLLPLAEAQGVKLTFLPFIVKAVVAALKKHPILNSLIDDAAQEVVTRKTYDIGIAVATPAGLIVPVLRGADRLTVIEVAREIDRLAQEAREGKTRREDLGGSSFTITSLGKLGGLFATPVVNYPEVGILFVPAMKKRPIVVGDEIRIGHVMDLSLSFDHRVINGADGAEFTQAVISVLQEPDLLFLEM